MSKAAERRSQRDRILEAALQHVPFDGWNRKALLAGAADAGIDASAAKRLFPRGGDDLLAHLDVWADRRLVEAVDQQAIDRLRLRERIARLVRMRLDILTPHREAMRRAIAARLLPNNALKAGPSLWRTMDLIWAIAGDRTDDASYYTKRGLLLTVWTSTFFYWLEDHSPGLEESWAFLDRRIDNVMQIGRVRGQVEGLIKNLERLNPLKA
ncbi:MAG: COQ9 family protein [Geminicoccaceae bacterium]